MTSSNTTLERAYADALISRLKHVKTCGSRWLVYTNGCWRESRRDTYRPHVYCILPHDKWLARTESNVLNQVEGRSQCDESIFKGALAFHDNGVVINTTENIIHVTSDSITPLSHHPDFYFTRALNVIYDPVAPFILYPKALNFSLPDDADQLLLQLSYGNFLLPDCRFESALICFGATGCGKSTLSGPIAKIFGETDHGLVTRLTMSQICDPNCYALAKLRYACVNLGTELQSIAVDESANFKQLVSGEPLEARPIYCAPFTMHTHCKLWFLANELPRFKNGTDAELRRIRFLRFTNHPATPDVLLKDRVLDETSGVFNYMLRGLQLLLKNASMPTGGEHSTATRTRFQVSNDPLGTFLKNECTFGVELSVSKDALREAFNESCERAGIDFGPNSVHFFRKLYDRFPSIKETRLRNPDGSRHQVVIGLALKHPPEVDELVVKV